MMVILIIVVFMNNYNWLIVTQLTSHPILLENQHGHPVIKPISDIIPAILVRTSLYILLRPYLVCSKRSIYSFHKTNNGL